MGKRLPVIVVAVVGALAIVGAAAAVLPDLTAPHGFFVDFRITIWEPGRALLTGEDPFHPGADVNGGVYPPAAVVLTLPFAALPYTIAVALWLSGLLGAVIGAIFLCGVRDWRCLVLALLSPPVLVGLAYGNVSLLLVLGLAIVWICRDRAGPAGAVLGVVIATRLFPWPLLLWLLFTRRVRAATIAAGSTVLLSSFAWSVVGVGRTDEFFAVTRSNATKFADQGVSVASIAANLGASSPVIACSVALLGGFGTARAWLQREDDLACLSWMLAATLALSPIVWGHYLALLLVPLALGTPTFARKWFAPFMTAPQLTSSPTAGGKILDASAGIAFIVWTALNTERGRRSGMQPARVSRSAADR